jgi:hypothetical protein
MGYDDDQDRDPRGDDHDDSNGDDPSDQLAALFRLLGCGDHGLAMFGARARRLL